MHRTHLDGVTGSGTGGAVTGTDANGYLGGQIDRLLDNSAPWLTVTSGAEPDDVTADILTNDSVPVEDAKFLENGWKDGMGVRLIWPAENTGAATLAVNGGAAIPVVDIEGTAFAGGELTAGRAVALVHAASELRVVSPVADPQVGGGAYYLLIATSGVIARPVGYDDDQMMLIEGWGAGGGGVTLAGGGGGGGYSARWMRLGAISWPVTATVPAGGAAGVAGGNTTFGVYLTAYGGGFNSGSGGGGGGALGPGSGATGGEIGGGNGGATPNALDIWGGAAGRSPGAGGKAVFGGGGGGGGGDGAPHAGGSSLYGGTGGSTGTAGATPGGGGGGGAAGGAGRIIISIP